MAARVTFEEVQSIMDVKLDVDKWNAFIGTANTLINSVFGTGDTPLLKEIEKWLTAHMVASTVERMAKKEEAGTAKIEYAGDYGEGLHSTSYGQMVLTLDTSGRLATLMGRSAKIYAIKSFTK